jgi:hypothetical protein
MRSRLGRPRASRSRGPQAPECGRRPLPAGHYRNQLPGRPLRTRTARHGPNAVSARAQRGSSVLTAGESGPRCTTKQPVARAAPQAATEPRIAPEAAARSELEHLRTGTVLSCPGHQPETRGDLDIRALERQSHSVSFAGHGRRARSADRCAEISVVADCWDAQNRHSALSPRLPVGRSRSPASARIPLAGRLRGGTAEV